MGWTQKGGRRKGRDEQTKRERVTCGSESKRGIRSKQKTTGYDRRKSLSEY